VAGDLNAAEKYETTRCRISFAFFEFVIVTVCPPSYDDDLKIRGQFAGSPSERR